MSVVGSLEIYLSANPQGAINGLTKAEFAFNQVAKNFEKFEAKVNAGVANIFRSVGTVGDFAEKVKAHLDVLKDSKFDIDPAGPVAALSRITDGVLNAVNTTEGALVVFSTFKTVAGNALLAVSRVAPRLGIALSTAMGPIGLIIGGIAAIGFVVATNFDASVKHITRTINYFRKLYNESSTFRASMEGIKVVFQTLFEYGKAWFEFFKTGFGTVGKLLKAVFTGDFSSIGTILEEGFDRAKTAAENFINVTKKNFANASINYLVNPKLEPLTEEAVKLGITGPVQALLDKLGIKLPFNIEGVSEAISETIQEVREKINIAPIEINNFIKDTSTGDNIFKNTLQALEGITRKYSILGDKQTELKDKINTTKKALQQMGSEGVDPNSQSVLTLVAKLQYLETSLDSLNGKNIEINGFEEVKNSVFDLNAALLEGLGDGLENLFTGLANGTASLKGSLNGVMRFFGGLMVQIGKNIIAAGKAIEALKSALSSLNGLAAIAAGAVLIGVGSLLKNIPAAANGAIAYGDTLIRVGDNTNSQVDPEVIQPLSKLKALIGENKGGYPDKLRVEGIIAGENIGLVNEEANYLNEIFR